MIVTTKNNEHVFVSSEADFEYLICNEIGEDAKDYYLSTLLKCEEYDTLENDYNTLWEENNQTEKENEELKYKLAMIEEGKDKELFNNNVYRIISKVRELESASKSQKVAGVKDEIIHMLKNMIIE